MTPLKSQILGIFLGLATAIGCIAYEKLVHAFGFLTVATINILTILTFGTIGYYVFNENISNDFHKFFSDWKYTMWTAVYVATGVTYLLWYKITKSQGIMVGSIYEVKYIVMLALIYIAFGDNKFTWNTAVGVSLALCSIYFISKS